MEQRSDFFNYLAEAAQTGQSLLSIPEISKKIGISTASLREQIEVARKIGLIDIKPKTGMSLRPYSLTPALDLSLGFAQKIHPQTFYQLSDLRQHLELAYFNQAAALLTKEDIFTLLNLVASAQQKIARSPIQNPQSEHRQFHTIIFSHLDNPLVHDFLAAYWDLYAYSEVRVYNDRGYLESVWAYHAKIADALKIHEITQAFDALKEHMTLIRQVKKAELKQRFE